MFGEGNGNGSAPQISFDEFCRRRGIKIFGKILFKVFVGKLSAYELTEIAWSGLYKKFRGNNA